MKIIEQSRAPNPRRVRIFLAEKGISVPYEQIDIMTLDHRQPGFIEKNPMQQIPVLVLDDGRCIAESVAICRYFEALTPEPSLFGRTAFEQATVEMMNRRIELGLFSRIAQVFRHTHPSMAEMEKPQIKEWGDANRARIGEMLVMLDAGLGRHQFIAGSAYSIADITLLAAVDFMRPIKYARPPELTNLARWYDEVSSRPSAKA
jgi:glutathione S-transferase